VLVTPGHDEDLMAALEALGDCGLAATITDGPTGST
jgi:hypothetical protein